MSDQPFVKSWGVSMVGVSTGAQLALATASHFPEKVQFKKTHSKLNQIKVILAQSLMGYSGLIPA